MALQLHNAFTTRPKGGEIITNPPAHSHSSRCFLCSVHDGTRAFNKTIRYCARHEAIIRSNRSARPYRALYSPAGTKSLIKQNLPQFMVMFIRVFQTKRNSIHRFAKILAIPSILHRVEGVSGNSLWAVFAHFGFL